MGILLLLPWICNDNERSYATIHHYCLSLNRVKNMRVSKAIKEVPEYEEIPTLVPIFSSCLDRNIGNFFCMYRWACYLCRGLCLCRSASRLFPAGRCIPPPSSTRLTTSFHLTVFIAVWAQDLPGSEVTSTLPLLLFHCGLSEPVLKSVFYFSFVLLLVGDLFLSCSCCHYFI